MTDMTDTQGVEERFWTALRDDRTLMLGLDGVEDGHARPMTAQFDEEGGPIWFFTSTDNGVVEGLPKGNRAIATFVDKGHDLFATIHGRLSIDHDGPTIDRLWSDDMAAWYDGGRNDPNLRLLRLDGERAEIWETSAGLFDGIRLFFGAKPKNMGEAVEIRLD